MNDVHDFHSGQDETIDDMIDVFSEIEKHLDVCRICYERMSSVARKCMELKPYTLKKRRCYGDPKQIVCGVCSRNSLYWKPVYEANCELINHPCYENEIDKQTSGCCTMCNIPRKQTSMSNKMELAEHLFTEDLVIHLLTAEEKLRKTTHIQNLYRDVRSQQRKGIIPPETADNMIYMEAFNESHLNATLTSYVLEDDIQRYILQQHGVPNVKIRITHDDNGLPIIDKTITNDEHEYSNSILNQYRSIMKKFVLVPTVRKSAFFLRNNIQTIGYQVGALVDQNIPLLVHSNNGIVDEKRTLCTVGDLLNITRQNGKKFLVILSGSIT